MTVGTPGFIGERLTEAREARGLTKVALAELVDVSAVAISQYESGPQTPRSDVLDKISERLNFPRAFFLKKAIGEEVAPIFWRSNASATKVARQRALQRLKWIKETTLYLEQDFDFPAVEFPQFAMPSDFRDLTSAKIESYASECREFWNYKAGPIPDLMLELENSGAVTSRINMAAETLDAFSQWSDEFGRPFVVLGKDGASAVRSRFDAAHELGHLILHRHVDRKCINKKEDWKLLETQAHKFAACFLFPAKSFCDELWAPTLDGFLALKERWRVSVKMMIMRAKTLDIIDDYSAQRLYINYNRRGWNVEEPLDAALEPEQPRILRRSFDELFSSGIRTKDQVASELSLPIREIEEISATPPGYFAGRPAEEGKAMPRLKSAKKVNSNSGAEVISLGDFRKRD